MCLKEMGAALAGWRVEIVATDLSQAVLEKSKAGIFSQFEVQRGLPIQMLVKHFTQIGELWQLNADIRAMVQHRQLNLLQDFSHLGTFDVIFCRNVLIYFDQDTKVGDVRASGQGARDRRHPGAGRGGNRGRHDRRLQALSGAARAVSAQSGARCAAPAGGAMPQALRSSPRVTRRSRLQDRMRQKPRGIAGDRIFVLADRQSARGVIDQPASEHRILPEKFGSGARAWRMKPSAP